MREDLMGYLLGALDEADRQRIERALESDPKFREELDQLRNQLDCLQSSRDLYEPAGHLFEQTCDLVEGVSQQGEAERADDSVGKRPVLPRFSPVRLASAQACGWSLADLLVVAGLFLAMSMFFLPAIANSRFRSRITACQYNLQVIGSAMASYSDKHSGRFPEIPASGNGSAAGIVAPILREQQYLTEDRSLLCPGAPSALRPANFRTPTLAQLDRASGLKLRQLQGMMGGSYGYSLSYQQDGNYVAPRNRRRSYYALISDAPSLYLPGGQSDNHTGRGQNVLFEDQSIQFFSNSIGRTLGDSFFRNHFGYTEAGINQEDAVIGGSAIPPLVVTR